MYEHAIPVDALVQEVGRPDGPLLTDVRIDPDFDDDPRILPAAIRMPHTEIERRSRDFEGRRVVVYCQKGLKLSMGAAAILRDCGIQAAFLTGGQFAWRDAGAPLLTAARLPTRTAGRRTRWVAAAGPAPDILAVVWLIRRFADPCARILRADPEHVEAIADKFDASPIRTCGGVEGTLRATAAGWGLASPEIDALASSLSEPGVAEMLERLLCGAAKAFGSDKEREHVGLSFFDAMLAESHDRRNRSRTDD